MLEKGFKYRIYLVYLIIIGSALWGTPPFHYGYYDNPPLDFCFLINLTTLFLFLIPLKQFIVVEKIVYPSLVSLCSSIIAIIVVARVMDFIYGTDTNWDELNSPAVLDSFLFYLLTYFLGVGFFKLWLTYKKPIAP